MMYKRSDEHVPCTWCDKDALPNVYPPACEKHKDRSVAVAGRDALDKNAAESDNNNTPETLKELLC